jgi:glycosyltransferase involved in cell wall biosynthesis
MQTVLHGKPAETGFDKASITVDGMTVAVIIPTFNHARFLGEAIESVRAQTRPADEIIVVDDGSTDNAEVVVAQFPDVRLIRTENRGPSAARNTGLWNCKADYVIFLDADDRLLPTALEAGLVCAAAHPDCAFFYGGLHRVSEDGTLLSSHIYKPLNGDAYLEFLRRNQVSGIMSVLFRRDCLLAVNGFDETLRRAEDYDSYLRIARKYRIVTYPDFVAEYRKHSYNASNDHLAQLKATLLVLGRHRQHLASDDHRAALVEGRKYYRSLYASRMVDAAIVRWRACHSLIDLLGDVIRAARWSPFSTFLRCGRGLGRRAKIVLERMSEML